MKGGCLDALFTVLWNSIDIDGRIMWYNNFKRKTIDILKINFNELELDKEILFELN